MKNKPKKRRVINCWAVVEVLPSICPIPSNKEMKKYIIFGFGIGYVFYGLFWSEPDFWSTGIILLALAFLAPTTNQPK